MADGGLQDREMTVVVYCAAREGEERGPVLTVRKAKHWKDAQRKLREAFAAQE